MRWALQRVRQDVARVGGTDPIAQLLVAGADNLLEQVRDVLPLTPSRSQLDRLAAGDRLTQESLRPGLEPSHGSSTNEVWVVVVRWMASLGWHPWMNCGNATLRPSFACRASLEGGIVRVGRSRETVVPLSWTDPIHRSMGHLLPDMVIHYRTRVDVVDAKYKAHLAELD